MSYSIQKADIGDHKGILLSLWKRNSLEVVKGRFLWIYENNPNGTPVLFFLRNEPDQSVVGAITLFPRAIFINGGKIRAYICGDMVVDQKHRSLGPAILLMKAAIRRCREEAPCILLSFPNDKSELVARRVGFRVLGEHLEMTRVIKTQRYLQRYFCSRSLSGALSLPLDWLLRLRHEVLCTFNTKEYHYEIVTEFDKRCDEFFKNAKSEFFFIGERDSRYLNWRISRSPYSRYKIFILMPRARENIMGYIAFSVDNRRAHVVDMAFDGNMKTFHILFHLFGKYIKMQSVGSVSTSIATNPKMINAFKKQGFSIRGLKNMVVIYSSPEDMYLMNGIETSGWYLTPTDNDI